MDSESPADPRDEPLEPVPEEIDAWAGREHKRREAWLTGPTDAEKQEWTRRYRYRALVGLAESRLPPSRDDVLLWASRERKRREAWLEGPTEDEKQDWARRYRLRTLTGVSESSLPPTAEDIEAWAAREGQRRREWLAGPSEEERRRWARRQAGGLLTEWSDWMRSPSGESEIFDAAHRFLREAELAGKGSLYALSRAPMALWAYFVRAGEKLEEDLSAQPRRRRVPF
jgi:hypothetical protein